MNGGGAVVRLFFFVGISKRYNFSQEISWDGTNFIVYIKFIYNIQWVYAQV